MAADMQSATAFSKVRHGVVGLVANKLNKLATEFTVRVDGFSIGTKKLAPTLEDAMP